MKICHAVTNYEFNVIEFSNPLNLHTADRTFHATAELKRHKLKISIYFWNGI